MPSTHAIDNFFAGVILLLNQTVKTERTLADITSCGEFRAEENHQRNQPSGEEQIHDPNQPKRREPPGGQAREREEDVGHSSCCLRVFFVSSFSEWWKKKVNGEGGTHNNQQHNHHARGLSRTFRTTFRHHPQDLRRPGNKPKQDDEGDGARDEEDLGAEGLRV